jgi:formylglycine-generating enzyme required for sulfatase activity
MPRRGLGAFLLFAILGCFAQERDIQITPDRERRLALVIGADNYLHASKLRNAVNDANDLAAALKNLGFTVDQVTDPDLPTMERAIDRFVGKVGPGDVALFHFSGHGIQIQGENFLVPVDFNARNEIDAKYESYSASRVQEHLERSGARLNILILDACRNNNFGGSRSAGQGLAAMHAGRGTYVAFATAQGQTADDNPEGRNGLFTSRLLTNLQQPGLDLNAVFDRVRAEVYETSGKRQLPWTSSSVIGEFYFRPPVAAIEPEPEPGVDPELQVELTYWNSIQESKNPAAFEAYLQQFQTGRFADLARIKLAELRPPPAAPARPPVAANPVSANPAPARPTPIVEPNTALSPGTVRQNAADGLNYVWIPPGSAFLGCEQTGGECGSAEEPRHQVQFGRGFWLGQTEVTVAAYTRFAQSTVRAMPPTLKPGPGGNGADHPMVRVSWDDAKEYCEWAGGRLPTEAEWEYAARGGLAGSDTGDLDRIAWYKKNSGGTTHATASKEPNGWGLFDMQGNVWEWCSDSYEEGANARVLRGGSMNVTADFVRLSVRGRNVPGARRDDYGFRCAGQSGP